MKMRFIRLVGIIALFVGGCMPNVEVTPSKTPAPLLPSPTVPCANDPFCQPTETPTPTLSPTPVPGLEVLLEGCDWGIDISHGMGEVTNAYLLARNPGATAIHTLCLELFASDEGRPHPDKKHCYSELPTGKQVVVKLTVDTTYGTNTDYYVVITSAETTMQVPTQRCQPIKDGVKVGYEKVRDLIQNIGK